MDTVTKYTGVKPKPYGMTEQQFNDAVQAMLTWMYGVPDEINEALQQALTLSDLQLYSAAATYNIGDVVVGSNGNRYPCIADGTTADDPVTSESGNWGPPLAFSAGDVAAFLVGRNLLVNGGFQVWQYGDSQTGSGYDSDDRWINWLNGTTRTHSRQEFSAGQTDVPGNPRYFSRSEVASVAGSANGCYKSQCIGRVAALSGQTVTLSFWAKADAVRNIAISCAQYFGSGGSSEVVTPVELVALSASWQQFSVSFTVPSVAGKTIDAGDCTEIRFWFDAGTGYDAETGSLGQQSGTFDLAQVQLETGSSATSFDRRDDDDELRRCQYRYIKFGPNSTSECPLAGGMFNVVNSLTATCTVHLPATMAAAAPDLSYSSAAALRVWQNQAYQASTSITIAASGDKAVALNVGMSVASSGAVQCRLAPAAWIGFSCELRG